MIKQGNYNSPDLGDSRPSRSLGVLVLGTKQNPLPSLNCQDLGSGLRQVIKRRFKGLHQITELKTVACRSRVVICGDDRVRISVEQDDAGWLRSLVGSPPFWWQFYAISWTRSHKLVFFLDVPSYDVQIGSDWDVPRLARTQTQVLNVALRLKLSFVLKLLLIKNVQRLSAEVPCCVCVCKWVTFLLPSLV